LSGKVAPELGEEDARAHDETPVENCVEGVIYDFGEALGSREPVSESTNGDSLSIGIVVFPPSNERDEGVTLEFSVEEIGDHVEFGDESGPHDDGDVRGIEQFDGEGHFVTTYLSVTQSQFNAESLEVDNYKEDNHSSDQAGKVRRAVTEKGVLQGVNFIGLAQQGVEKGDDGSFIFAFLASLDESGGETLPEDHRADVTAHEEGDSASDTVTLL